MNTLQHWLDRLDMQPHAEGGWYKEIWRSEREACSLIYYALGRDDVSRWHRVRSDELWLWHAGGVLEMKLGGTGESPQAEQTLLLGAESEARDGFQGIVPADVWQTARVVAGDFVLVSCVVAPAFQWTDFTLHTN
jgi:predicted cupin superfamily sugar epimerase